MKHIIAFILTLFLFAGCASLDRFRTDINDLKVTIMTLKTTGQLDADKADKYIQDLNLLLSRVSPEKEAEIKARIDVIKQLISSL